MHGTELCLVSHTWVGVRRMREGLVAGWMFLIDVGPTPGCGKKQNCHKEEIVVYLHTGEGEGGEEGK